MKESVRLGRLAGVTVGFNWSALLMAAIFAVGLGSGKFPLDAPGYPGLTYAAAGAVTAVAFLGCILIHEMSHAVVARREGLPVDGIVLWLMGGYTRIGADPEGPGAEFRISGAGPLASLVLGLLAGAAAFICHDLGATRLAVSVFAWLATINVLLALFNVLPGSPLDGGRILHAGVWAWTHDRWRASRAAAHAGRLIGGGLIAAGGALVLFAHNDLDGFWFIVVGWFLATASRLEAQGALILHQLEGLAAADVMAPFPPVAPGWLTAEYFLQQCEAGGGPTVFLLQRWGGGVDALVTLDDVRAVPEAYRSSTRVIDVGTGFAGLPTAGPGEPAPAVLRRMEEKSVTWALVVDAGHIVGVISERMLLEAARRSGQEHGEPVGVGSGDRR